VSHWLLKRSGARSRFRRHPSSIAPETPEGASAADSKSGPSWIDADDLVSAAVDLMDRFPPCEVLAAAARLEGEEHPHGEILFSVLDT
jgi:hypothetical protein